MTAPTTGPPIGTTVGVEQCNDLIESTAQALRRNREPHPDRKSAFGIPNCLLRSHEVARRYPMGRGLTRPDLPFPQIATGDLDIPIVGQLLAANLPLGDEFEPGPVQVVGFDAAFRRGGLGKQGLEHAPGNAHHALIFAQANAELDY
jgi:hypothetical protein